MQRHEEAAFIPTALHSNRTTLKRQSALSPILFACALNHKQCLRSPTVLLGLQG